MKNVRALALSTIVVMMTAAPPANAETLIGFTDTSPNSAFSDSMTDTTSNLAAQWSQTDASTNVTVRALLYSFLTPSPASWWITDSIGLTATAANVIASGTYVPADLQASSGYNDDPRTTLATGLNFAAGTYYLVLDGPPSPFSNHWAGDFIGGSTTLAPGFSVDGYYSTGLPEDFAPSSRWTPRNASDPYFVFELESGAVPEPATWAMTITGFGLVGRAMRRRPRLTPSRA